MTRAAGATTTREGDYIVERYHVSFRLELRRLKELGNACRDLKLLDDCQTVCAAFIELSDALVHHMDEQDIVFSSGCVGAIAHAHVRDAAARLSAALAAASPSDNSRRKALLFGLAHLVAEIEDHLELEERIARRDGVGHLFSVFQGLEPRAR